MDELVRWASLAFIVVCSLMQAAYLFGGKGTTLKGVTRTIDALQKRDDVLGQRIHDLVDFWETRFVSKDVADARYQDLQGQVNRLREDVTQINKRTIH